MSMGMSGIEGCPGYQSEDFGLSSAFNRAYAEVRINIVYTAHAAAAPVHPRPIAALKENKKELFLKFIVLYFYK